MDYRGTWLDVNQMRKSSESENLDLIAVRESRLAFLRECEEFMEDIFLEAWS